MKQILDRMKEPSSWSALSVMALVIGVQPELLEQLQGWLVAILAGLGVALKESK